MSDADSKFPPSREAITAALIVCDTSFWSSYQHPKLATSLPAAHSIHKLKLWQDKTNMQCHESSKLLVSTLSFQSVSKFQLIVFTFRTHRRVRWWMSKVTFLSRFLTRLIAPVPFSKHWLETQEQQKGVNNVFETDPKSLVSGSFACLGSHTYSCGLAFL